MKEITQSSARVLVQDSNPQDSDEIVCGSAYYKACKKQGNALHNHNMFHLQGAVLEPRTQFTFLSGAFKDKVEEEGSGWYISQMAHTEQGDFWRTGSSPGVGPSRGLQK